MRCSYIQISFLPPKKIVSIVRIIDSAIGEKICESDFLLRGLKIKNTTNESIRILSFTFDLKAKDKSVKTIHYSEHALKNRGAEVYQLMKRFTLGGSPLAQIYHRDNLHRIMGTDQFWAADQLVKDINLASDQEFGFFFEHFKVTAEQAIDEIMVVMKYKISGEEKQTSLRIPVVKKEREGNYIFPVRGTWIVAYNWVDTNSHRSVYSQEFAFDIWQVDYTKGREETIGQPITNSPGYGADILAIADGKVVGCVDGVPDNQKIGDDLTSEQIAEIIDMHGSTLPAGAGNHVVLEHSSREYSFYAHLIPESLTVKIGDLVKQGDVLGKLGNSGNSEGPHLHFHLMDGPDYFTNRGLPCHFTNVINLEGEQLDIIDVNYSPVIVD